MLINEAMKKMPLQYSTVQKISKQKPFGDTIESFIQFMKKTENETIVTIAALNKHLIAKNMLPFIPIISKDIAINEHKKMWEWIAHETHSRKKCITKDKYFAEKENIFNITPAYMDMLRNMCFACQYCKQLKDDPTYATNPFLPKTSADCPYCPLDWNTNHKNYPCENTDEESGTGLFSEWQCYTFQKPNPAMARLFANEIAHLNRTKLNLYDVACNAYVHKKNKYTIKALYEAIDEAVNVNGFNLKTLQQSIDDDTFFEHITKRSKGRIRYNVIYRERNNEPTFIEKCMNNQETPENIDAYIEQWHNSQSNKSLSEFLGMTENEYALYLETNRDIINKIIKQRGDK